MKLTRKQILDLIALLEELYESNDELLWKEIFYKLDKLKETT